MRIEKVVLKRVDRKLWSFGEREPVRVELAVLQYLEQQGWEGYFTEHWNFEATCIALMSWPERKKQMPKGISSLDSIYFMGSDGWLKTHMFSFSEVMESLINFNASDFHDVYNINRNSKSHRFFIGSQGNKGRSFSEIDGGKLCRFFNASGKDFLISEAQAKFTHSELEDRIALHHIEGVLSDFFRDGKLSRDDYSPRHGLSHAAFHAPSRYDTAIADWRRYSSAQTNPEAASTILASCDIAERARERTLLKAGNVQLDLRIWRDNVQAFVEVKAPNDRLSKSQRTTILDHENKSRNTWVIEVEAA